MSDPGQEWAKEIIERAKVLMGKIEGATWEEALETVLVIDYAWRHPRIIGPEEFNLFAISLGENEQDD